MIRKLLLFLITVVTLGATQPTYENATRLYVATFDRVPDVAGLKYWVDDSQFSLEEIAMSFFSQPETKSKYYPDGTIDLSNFVDEVYINLFDRAPDSIGSEYWVEAMDIGSVHYSTFILAVINGAQGNDAAILADKTKYAMDQIQDQLNPEPPVDPCKNKRDGQYNPGWDRQTCNAHGYFWCPLASTCLDKSIDVLECGENHP